MRNMLPVILTLAACTTPSRDYVAHHAACDPTVGIVACNLDGDCVEPQLAHAGDPPLVCSIPSCAGAETTGYVFTSHGTADTGELPACGEIGDRAYCYPTTNLPEPSWATWRCQVHNDAIDETQDCVLDACAP